MDGCIDGLIKCVVEWLNGLVGGWMDGGKRRWMDGLVGLRVCVSCLDLV